MTIKLDKIRRGGKWRCRQSGERAVLSRHVPCEFWEQTLRNGERNMKKGKKELRRRLGGRAMCGNIRETLMYFHFGS